MVLMCGVWVGVHTEKQKKEQKRLPQKISSYLSLSESEASELKLSSAAAS